jgi:diguanylate cyclase (GGDEF)-like protein
MNRFRRTRDDAPERRSNSYDPVTGVLDRASLCRVIEARLEQASAHSVTGAVIAVGVDHLRSHNADHGWNAGTDVLRAVAATLRGGAGQPDALGRISSDVFTVVLDRATVKEAEVTAERLLDDVRALSTHVDGRALQLTASAGVAPLRGFDRSFESVANEADLALSLAKAAGRNCVRTYSSELRGELTSHGMWAGQLRDALDRDDLRVLSQPVRSSMDAAPSQHELLVRMYDTDGDLLPPREFLPIAERYGLVERIDRWVVDRAVAMIAAADDPLVLEINVSAHSVADPEFPDHVRRRVAEAGIDPAALIFEIDEPKPGADLDPLQIFVERLREVGCRFALDNFGTGSASLGLLKKLPVDFVKIDARFMRHLTRDPADRALVRAIASLASELGMQTVATLVTDDETAELAGELGVDLIQGFHVGLPAVA